MKDIFRTYSYKLKRILFKFNFILIIILSSFAGDNPKLCEEIIKQSCKALEPYNYDSAESTIIKYKGVEQKLSDIEVTLYFGERYRFVFNTENAPNGIKIEVFDKKSKSSNRQLLFSSEEFKNNKKILYFEPTKSRTMYINYTIPAVTSSDSLKTGCVAFALGYEIKKLF
ncbi:MAG: hypothetical protein A2X12_01060 [Bacteroidetes bacterium GWE2_29_8]|nr:MAG: hypothetical protein A2X12_01060 [Bacteroidetes bacterium GWE2_29_8]OFY14402.1 MAG: hypothetical protein A2X02_01195 [Bacteroidetes bacterium GWF2_29_10]